MIINFIFIFKATISLIFSNFQSYDKQGFHTGTPPPFNLAGSGTNPMTANAYPPMFIPTIPAAAQHHSPLMHHQLHQVGFLCMWKRKPVFLFISVRKMF